MSIIDTIVFLIFTGGVVLLGCSFLEKIHRATTHWTPMSTAWTK